MVRRAFVAVVVLLLVWFAWSLRAVLIPYIVGLIIAGLLSPLVRHLEKHVPGKGLKDKTRHTIAAATVYVTSLVLVIAFLLFWARNVLNQLADMLLGVPADWQRMMSENPTIHTWYVNTIPADIRAHIEASLVAESVAVVTWLNRTVTAAISSATGLVDAVLTVIAVGLFLFYVMIRDEKMPNALENRISPGWRLHFGRLREIAHTTITSYARALLTEATIVGSLTGIGLFLAGVQVALPLAIVSGLCNLVPYIGYWLALLLSIVVVGGSQPDKLVLAIAVYLIVQSADNWYFAPHYQGGSTGWTPAQTLVIMACGNALVGPVGLIVALPLAAFIRETIMYTYRQLGPPASPEEDAAEPAPVDPVDLSQAADRPPGVRLVDT